MDAKKIGLWALFILLIIAVLMMFPKTRGKVSPLVGKVPVAGAYIQKIPSL